MKIFYSKLIFVLFLFYCPPLWSQDYTEAYAGCGESYDEDQPGIIIAWGVSQMAGKGIKQYRKEAYYDALDELIKQAIPKTLKRQYEQYIKKENRRGKEGRIREELLVIKQNDELLPYTKIIGRCEKGGIHYAKIKMDAFQFVREKLLREEIISNHNLSIFQKKLNSNKLGLFFDVKDAKLKEKLKLEIISKCGFKWVKNQFDLDAREISNYLNEKLPQSNIVAELGFIPGKIAACQIEVTSTKGKYKYSATGSLECGVWNNDGTLQTKIFNLKGYGNTFQEAVNRVRVENK